MRIRLNMGRKDRLARLVAATLIAAVLTATGFSAVVDSVLMVAGALLFATAVVGYCPLYSIFGFSTLESNGEQRRTRAG